MTFKLLVPLQSDSQLQIDLEPGSALFLLGANGTGKSSLVHRFFVQNSTRALRISAHRQTWFQSGSVSLTGEQRRSTGHNIRSWDSQANARWLEVGPAERASMALYDLVDAQNIRARGIADAVDANDIDLALQMKQKDAPIRLLNDVLRMSSIPIEISLRGNEELQASKSGCAPYSVAELSDGERNVLLIASNVLTAQPGTLLLIDEPERHIHRSISSRLLTLLFAHRSDCAFVISTHDVTLPLDDTASRRLLLRSCSWDASKNAKWDADLLEPSAQIDEQLTRDILGARPRAFH